MASREKQYILVALRVYVETAHNTLLTIGQRLVYDSVMEYVRAENCGIRFWIHQWGGGAGKHVLYLLLAEIQIQCSIALESSRTSATLL